MSREIKFRAWNGQKFINDYYNHSHFVSINDGKLIQVQYDDVCPEGVVYGKPEQMKLQQYTGLKDKNGVEIYEGDIIECWGSTLVVYWEDSDASFFAVNTDSNAMCESGQEWSGRCKVIGNIYQNPELLK